MKLADLQDTFQKAVLSEDDKAAKVLDALAPPARAERSDVFGVYVHGYRLRLAEYVEEDYPTLRALMGDSAFAKLIAAYIAANPSRSRNARYFSTKIPEHLVAHPYRKDPKRAVSLAKLERALSDAFDAKDVEPITLEALAAFVSEEWPRLVFAFHPSVSVIVVAAGTTAAYAALLGEEKTPLPKAGPGEEIVAIWRAELEPLYRILDEDEHLALNEAMAGKSFGDICQMVAFQDESTPAAERLAQFLVNWFSEGMIVGVGKAQNTDGE